MTKLLFSAEDFLLLNQSLNPGLSVGYILADKANLKHEAECPYKDKAKTYDELGMKHWTDIIYGQQDVLKDFQEENARLREALEWYARESVWKRSSINREVDLLERRSCTGQIATIEICPAECDAGLKARAALEGK